MKDFNQLLSSVSRSFYLSMRFLPYAMRPAISVAYLLARATDTVADTVQTECAERLALLSMMGAVIAGDASRDEVSACFGRLGVLAARQKHEGEAELLARFPECVAQLAMLTSGERLLVQDVLVTILRGQRWDLEYFAEHASVSCPEQVEHYTYMVAGCVGEFWTRLGLLTQGAVFSTHAEEELLLWGCHYGMGLQLVNILRDREEDRLAGRSYLPSDEVGPWMEKAERWLKEGIFYAESLPCGRLRFSTVLPAWLGLDTLNLLDKGGCPRTGKVKISRKQVYARLWKAFLFSWKEAV